MTRYQQIAEIFNNYTPVKFGLKNMVGVKSRLVEETVSDTPASPQLWFATSSGRIEISLTLDDARSGSHQGTCDADVRALSAVPYIAQQLKKINPALLASELSEYGAWGDEELKDHDQNIQRILWLACGDIREEAAR
jgi:hypothetical protein